MQVNQQVIQLDGLHDSSSDEEEEAEEEDEEQNDDNEELQGEEEVGEVNFSWFFCFAVLRVWKIS